MIVKRKRRAIKGNHFPLSPGNACPLSPKTCLADIRQLLASGQFEQAKKILLQADQQHIDQRELSLGWAYYYLAIHQLENAENALGELLDRLPVDHEALILGVEISLNRKNIVTAAKRISIALENYPADAEVLRHACKVHQQAGNENDALLCLETALKSDPDNIAVLVDLSTWYIHHRQWWQSQGYLLRLSHLLPNNASVFLGLGTSCLRMGDHQGSLQALQRSLQLDSENTQAMINLGVVFRLIKQPEKALQVLTKALGQDPHNTEVLSALSSLYVDTQKPVEGLHYALQAVHHAPENPDSLVACAYAHLKSGHHPEAEQLYRKVLLLNPQHAQAGFGLASVLLLHGELELGWKYYRARFDVQQIWLDGPWPIWNGESLDGKSLLVRIEQGHGDTIQFVRFLPWLRHLNVGRVLLSCSPSLRRLLSGFEHFVDFLQLELQVDSVQADYQTALMELPGLLGVNTVEKIPPACPYLFADKQDVLKWQGKVNDCAQGRFTIGLVWAGNPKQTDDHNRSMALQEFVPILDLDGCCFFSLQIGESADQVRDFRNKVVDLTGDIHDFSDTAAFMTSLDFIISVCTAPIHLAGALNRPGAVLLSYMADWRWFLDRDDSPWYPSLQLFRQSTPGDWQSVVGELKKYIENKWLR